jgi:hypothetical protein
MAFHSLHATSQALHPMQTEVYVNGYRQRLPVMEAVWPANALYLGRSRRGCTAGSAVEQQEVAADPRRPAGEALLGEHNDRCQALRGGVHAR